MNVSQENRTHSGHCASQGGTSCHTGDRTAVNVNEAERNLSMVGGSVLAVCGLLRGSLSGLALAAIGGALIYRGHTGHCEIYHMLGHSSADQPESQPQHDRHERVSYHDESHAAAG